LENIEDYSVDTACEEASNQKHIGIVLLGRILPEWKCSDEDGVLEVAVDQSHDF